MIDNKQNSKTDPVCGMDLSEAADFVEVLYKERAFYFCSDYCRERFEKNPEKFQREPLLKLSNIWKIFKLGNMETQVLKGLSINIWKGDFTAIIGASGSGKTTVLNMLGLLDRPSSGRIFLEGKDVSLLKDEEGAGLRSKKFGFVFQQYNLMPWLTAYENITLPVVFAGKNINSERLEKQIQETGLLERMTHRPFELSGGEQQRVALLRALSNDPEIILGDEPTGNLDSATGNKILELLTNLNKIQKKTLVIVTHNADIAEKADQIIALKDGRLVKNHQTQRKMYPE
ncbi:MAG: lipoprotein-releasing system ATP-binding protein LolD [Candidatus Nealsonbacteria bacterium CG08_land_8_20_14_0_20_38_20]|uniref:Lipoprotein-releasing system ATP-binding protein LolD n=1 Tax=Candidatus Nealsonbacteria bacterium CG08_land_8_20_14_0_20_38_20 TaxID=1974705 RepID=A0A2H0YLS8_9BACT|nr:MAG: lipoprotein-releasing system ATP-binding protein LolD [Candidatus Nealsonbacteria bacterium CG08_land_8_20_14_0_20_38_20]